MHWRTRWPTCSKRWVCLNYTTLHEFQANVLTQWQLLAVLRCLPDGGTDDNNGLHLFEQSQPASIHFD